MPEYLITATQNGNTAYYSAFDLMSAPKKLLTTLDIDCANKLKSIEKADEWKAWLEKKFPEYTYQINPVQ